MKHKAFRAEVKASSDGVSADGIGTFEALVSAFNVVDKVGDRVMPGAFDATLKSWRDSGDPMPLMWSHKGWEDALSIIGTIDPSQMTTTPRGLYMKAEIDTTTELGAQVYKLLKKGLLREFSIGYTIPKGGESKANDGAYNLNVVDLVEVSVCLRGINPATELLAVKSASLAQVMQERAAEARRVKAYASIEIEGTYEERQADVLEALQAANPADAEGWVSVTIIATTDTDVIYTVCDNGEDESYRVSYTVADDGSIALGTPEAVAFQAVPDTDETKAVEPELEPLPEIVEAVREVLEPETKAVEAPVMDALAEYQLQLANLMIAETEALLGPALTDDAMDNLAHDRRLAEQLDSLPAEEE